MDFVAATPPEHTPDATILSQAKAIGRENGCAISSTADPEEAARGADVIYTDTWVSMGQEAEAQQKERSMMPYQVNQKLMALGKEDCLFMHCLPAHRGMEVTDGVIDGPHSVVFDQAENRLHAQKAILIRLMGGAGG
jgi:ornithine carbamoyltransferase